MAKGIKTGGRTRGTPNKATASVKDAITTVFEKLQDEAGGDHGHFLGWAKEQPTEFYKIASKLIPLQLAGDPDKPIEIAITRKIVGGSK